MNMDDVISQGIKTQIELNNLQNKTIDFLMDKIEKLEKENTELLKKVIRLNIEREEYYATH